MSSLQTALCSLCPLRIVCHVVSTTWRRRCSRSYYPYLPSARSIYPIPTNFLISPHHLIICRHRLCFPSLVTLPVSLIDRRLRDLRIMWFPQFSSFPLSWARISATPVHFRSTPPSSCLLTLPLILQTYMDRSFGILWHYKLMKFILCGFLYTLYIIANYK